MKEILTLGMIVLTGCATIQTDKSFVGECQINAQHYYKENPNNLPPEHIRMAVGKLKLPYNNKWRNHPHTWVEEYDIKYKKWFIVDPSQFNAKPKDYGKPSHYYGWKNRFKNGNL